MYLGSPQKAVHSNGIKFKNSIISSCRFYVCAEVTWLIYCHYHIFFFNFTLFGQSAFCCDHKYFWIDLNLDLNFDGFLNPKVDTMRIVRAFFYYFQFKNNKRMLIQCISWVEETNFWFLFQYLLSFLQSQN